MTRSVDHLEALIAHLRAHALRTDGPFTLRSGARSDWYLDARQTTFSGDGAALVGHTVLSVLDPAVGAVGGMTMGADPIAVATAIAAGGRLRAFSIRKTAKDHGVAGRLVGPAVRGDVVAVLDDTVTTGGALLDAVDVAVAAGLDVVQAIVLVDRSAGRLEATLSERGIPLVALVLPGDLGVAADPIEAPA